MNVITQFLIISLDDITLATILGVRVDVEHDMRMFLHVCSVLEIPILLKPRALSLFNTRSWSEFRVFIASSVNMKKNGMIESLLKRDRPNPTSSLTWDGVSAEQKATRQDPIITAHRHSAISNVTG